MELPCYSKTTLARILFREVILKVFLGVCTACFSLSGCMAGNIFLYVDSDGVHHFSDSRINGGYEISTRAESGSGLVGLSWLDSPLKRSKFDGAISKAAKLYRLPSNLLHAVIEVESNYNPDAVSSAGAVGLMQLMPATSARFGVVDARNPISNITGGARYLRYLIDLFEQDLQLVLAAYNAGENAVIKRGFRVPPFKETEEYVRKVLRIYNK